MQYLSETIASEMLVALLQQCYGCTFEVLDYNPEEESEEEDGAENEERFD